MSLNSMFMKNLLFFFFIIFGIIIERISGGKVYNSVLNTIFAETKH